jgi:multicomponent Na+:H+ antiporter subunit F
LNEWLIVAFVFLLALIPCGVVCIRGGPVDRLIAFELAQVVAVLVFLVLAQGMGQDAFFDLGLLLAILSFPGSLLFARFLERWV